MGQVYTIEEIKTIVNEVASRHGVKRVFLFGSHVRKDAKNGLNFRIDKGKIKGLLALGRLYAELEEGFGLPIVLLSSECLSQEFIQEISDGEVLVYDQGQ